MIGSSPAPISWVAAVLLSLEALSVLGIAVWEVVVLATSGAGSVPSALALIAMTLIAAAGIAAFAWGVLTDRSWGRSGGIVVQLLIIAVAVGAVTGAYAHPLIALGIGLPAAVILITLFLAARRPA